MFIVALVAVVLPLLFQNVVLHSADLVVILNSISYSTSLTLMNLPHTGRVYVCVYQSVSSSNVKMCDIAPP